MEPKTLFIPVDCGLHLEVGLVADDVVYTLEADGWEEGVEFLGYVVWGVAGEEGAGVVFALDKRMCCLAISAYSRQHNCSILILQHSGRHNRHSATLNSKLINSLRVLNRKRNIPNPITMLNQMMIHLLIRILLIN